MSLYLRRENCSFWKRGECRVSEADCKTKCKVTAADSAFHARLVVSGLTWEDLTRMQGGSR